jgi:two-component system response regulator YesN
MRIDIPLLKVLIVDDEPFVRKGLAALIDWEAEGFYIAGEASNGIKAIELLKQTKFDVIISDIKMPEMNGIEFITYIRNNNISKARVVFLSGFYDFHYAKTAIQCGCIDYILKPIQKDELLTLIRKIMDEHQKDIGKEKKKRDFEKAYLDRQLIAIIWGKYDSINLRYVEENMKLSEDMVYIHLEISLKDEKFHILSKEEKREQQRKLYNYATLLLKRYADHIIYDVMRHVQCYNIGIIFCSYMTKERELKLDAWIDWLIKELTERVGYDIVACTGNKVNSLPMLADSYRETVMIRSFRFCETYNKCFSKILESEEYNNCSIEDYFRMELDELVHTIEINDKQLIRKSAKIIYKSIMDKNIEPKAVSRNIEYLLHRLMGLAYNQDADVNQEMIMHYIYESVFSTKNKIGSELKFQQFSEEYSDYLFQLRQNTSKGSIDIIEAEIEENYAENISLKYLGEKYFFNSAYLGQLFKKRYGCCFKEYLNKVRIRKAAEIILSSDKKIYEIAVDVGYKNQDYFINKFEEVYGLTPTRFRKRNLMEADLNIKCIKNI